MILDIQHLLYYFLLILNVSLAFAWETVDTCQMSFFELEDGSTWAATLYYNDFSSNKTDLYDRLLQTTSGESAPLAIGQRYMVSNIEFDIPAIDDETVQTGTVLGKPITTTNFTMQALSFFEAKMDGDYTFAIEATDAAQGMIFTDTSPYCCGNLDDDNQNDVFQAGRKDFWSIPSDPTPRNDTITVSMKEGNWYVLAITYMNFSGDAKLKFTVTTPDGETTSDFSKFGGMPIAADCDNFHITSMDYSSWTFDSTSTYSSTVVTIDMTTTTTLETIYYVVTPTAVSSSVVESSTSEVLATSEVSSEVPVTSDVSSEVASTSDISSEVPLTSDDSSDTPLTSNVSSEVPMTSDISSETASNTFLTLAATSSYPSVDASSTSKMEYSTTLSNEETIIATFSTTTTEPSVVTTWSSYFLPSWFISNSSFPSSTPATKSDTVIPSDVETPTTSSNIGQVTQSIGTAKPAAIESTPSSRYGITTAPAGSDDRTTTAPALSTTTATMCRTCEGDRHSNDAAIDATFGAASTSTNKGAIDSVNNAASTNGHNAANGATTKGVQVNGASAAENQANTDGQGAGTTINTGSGNTDITSPSPAQASAYTTTTMLQGSTPALYSPEDNNAAGQAIMSNLLCILSIFILM